jgi:D-amino-acid oxidase
MDRRLVLKAVACLATTAVLDGCASRDRRAATAAGWRLPVLPVPDMRPEREVRTVVGLRPYRPSGVVVRSEKVGDTVVVHNRKARLTTPRSARGCT